MSREYDKLVRDDVPDLLRRDGKRVATHTADDAEYVERLNAKLDEEIAEYREDGTLEELADVLEVVYALAAAEGATRSELEELRAEKADRNGRFIDRIVVESVAEE
ncbi:nucleoside triphosphate pyrophosphohydrolase [Halosegnis longus]|uniref:nucleoside triphosphate pyrophosphohydrolase n=1 Tax=Halosegnis longus TaxID=2216012 RepID=UPI00096A5F5B|nr:nucleoside triphosphate pyrophosphohydrolase [Salella cibi]